MNQLPKDLGGYQHIQPGIATQLGDIWVIDGQPKCFVDYEFWVLVPDTTSDTFHYINGWNIYRKLPCPGCRDDKELWGEKTFGMSPGEIERLGKRPDELEMRAFKSTIQSFIPQDDKQRKMAPMFRGLLGYFPAALFEIAAHSMESDLKHNPGSVDGPTWSRNKSRDHSDCIVRHLIDAGTKGTPDRKYHLRALAWRACALLQEECEAEGALPGVSSR